MGAASIEVTKEQKNVLCRNAVYVCVQGRIRDSSWGREMNLSIRRNSFSVGLCGVLLLCASAAAQQKAQSAPQQRRAYDMSREVSVQGTVVSFAENSSTAPFGPHAVIQTTSGQVDVHLGDARLLKANQFTLAAGDSVRVVGENVPYGTGSQFFARILQKGNQTLTVRSTRGFPLRPASKAGKSEAGVL
jgi:hypothetical protein